MMVVKGAGDDLQASADNSDYQCANPHFNPDQANNCPAGYFALTEPINQATV